MTKSSHPPVAPSQSTHSTPAWEPALTILLAEIKEHFENIRSRVQLEQVIFNYSAVILAALIPVSVRIIEARVLGAFFFLPWVFCVLALLVLRQDLVIACIAAYAYRTLFPKVRQLANDDEILRLEVDLRKLRVSPSYLAIGVARYALFFLPSIAAIVAVIILKRRFADAWLHIDSVLLVLDLVILAVTAGLVVRLPRKAFLSIPKEHRG